MSKFKVGDKVVLIADYFDSPGNQKGDVGVIERFDRSGDAWAKMLNVSGNGYQYLCIGGDVEAKFAVLGEKEQSSLAERILVLEARISDLELLQPEKMEEVAYTSTNIPTGVLTEPYTAEVRKNSSGYALFDGMVETTGLQRISLTEFAGALGYWDNNGKWEYYDCNSGMDIISQNNMLKLHNTDSWFWVFTEDGFASPDWNEHLKFDAYLVRKAIASKIVSVVKGAWSKKKGKWITYCDAVTFAEEGYYELFLKKDVERAEGNTNDV